MNPKLKEKILESLSAVLPITGIVLLIGIFLVPIDLGMMVMFPVGALMLVVGMGFFRLGAEISMTPLGEGIGVQIEDPAHLIDISDWAFDGGDYHNFGTGSAGAGGTGVYRSLIPDLESNCALQMASFVRQLCNRKAAAQ